MKNFVAKYMVRAELLNYKKGNNIHLLGFSRGLKDGKRPVQQKVETADFSDDVRRRRNFTTHPHCIRNGNSRIVTTDRLKSKNDRRF